MTSPNRRRTYLQLRLNDLERAQLALPCFIGFDSYWGRAATSAQGQQLRQGDGLKAPELANARKLVPAG
jgi:hypothetical protein